MSNWKIKENIEVNTYIIMYLSDKIYEKLV